MPRAVKRIALNLFDKLIDTHPYAMVEIMPFQVVFPSLFEPEFIHSCADWERSRFPKILST